MRKLLSEINTISNRNVDMKIVDAIFQRFQKIEIEKYQDEVLKYTEMQQVVSSFLRIEGEKALEVIFNIQEKYSTVSDEAKITVFIFCIYFETCLTGFLKTYLLRKGTLYEIAENTLDELRSWDRQIKFFKNISGEKNLFPEDFLHQVNEIKKKRNKFTHRGQLFSITREDAEKGYQLAKKSISVFADLYNKFCLKKSSV
ncbi:MAG: hypothetical protein WDA18_08940 [Candidatus Ratteibacteria bacterium]